VVNLNRFGVVNFIGFCSIEQKVNYIHENPVKAMIVCHAHEYIFSSAIDFAEGKGLVNVIKF
jgi:hypothetical protein